MKPSEYFTKDISKEIYTVIVDSPTLEDRLDSITKKYVEGEMLTHEFEAAITCLMQDAYEYLLEQAVTAKEEGL